MNNTKIKALALQHGFKLKEQKTGEMDLNKYVYDFAWALLQSGKPNVSHKAYLVDLLIDSANCMPEKTIGYSVSIYANDVCADEPRMKWDFHNGIARDTFECRVPDTREELNKMLNNAKGFMKSACYRAMNPDYDKKLAQVIYE